MPKTDLGEEEYFGLNDYTVLSTDQITEVLGRLAKPVQPASGVSVVSLQPLETSPEGPNQDRWIVESWEILPGQVWTLAAVLDGHAGIATVDYAAKHLPGFVRVELSRVLGATSPEQQPKSEIISSALKTAISRFDGSIGQAVKDVFPQTALEDTSSPAYLHDKDIQKIVNDDETGVGGNAANILRAMHGSTAIVCILDPARTNIWVASLGDSQAVIARLEEQEWKAKVLSANHNGRDESEAARIQVEHPNEEECLLQGRVLGSIAVTRALGDFVFKLPAIYSERVFSQKKPGWNDRISAKMKLCNARNITPPYLSNEADVCHLEIPSAKEATDARPFLILCSDGLIDQYDHFAHVPTLAQTWVNVVAKSTEAGDSNKALALLRHALGGEDEDKISQRLTVEFTREKWMDDTTVVVIQL